MGFGVEVGDDAMIEYRWGDGFEVFERGHVGPAQGGARFGAEDKVLDGAGSGAPGDRVVDPCRCVCLAGSGFAHEANGSLIHVFGYGESSDELLASEDFRSVDQFSESGAMTSSGFARDAGFFFERGIVDLDEKHEAVELRFGQRVGAFLFDRVLGREDKKGRGERIGFAKDGDLVFLHRLEHGRLGLGGRSVDFIGEHHVRKDRALDEFEFSASSHARFLDDVGAGDVGGH